MVRLEGGGHHQVLPGREGEALRHLTHVDVGPAPGLGGVVAEEVLPELVHVVWGLEGQRDGWRKRRWGRRRRGKWSRRWRCRRGKGRRYGGMREEKRLEE